MISASLAVFHHELQETSCLRSRNNRSVFAQLARPSQQPKSSRMVGISMGQNNRINRSVVQKRKIRTDTVGGAVLSLPDKLCSAVNHHSINMPSGFDIGNGTPLAD